MGNNESLNRCGYYHPWGGGVGFVRLSWGQKVFLGEDLEEFKDFSGTWGVAPAPGSVQA